MHDWRGIFFSFSFSRADIDSVSSHAAVSMYIQESNDFLEHLPKASFVALDEEMTGINPTGVQRPTRDTIPKQSYPTFHKPAAEDFTLVQLGICLFIEGSEGGRWNVRRYNFYMFPDNANPRNVVLSAETARFLRTHNLSLDMCIEEGLPFQTLETAEELLQKFAKNQVRTVKNRMRNAKRKNATTTRQNMTSLHRQDDKDFVAKCLDMVAQWKQRQQQRQTDDCDPSLLLPECNSFLRRVLYERVHHAYPELELEPAAGHRPNQIRVWSANTSVSQRETTRHQEDWEHVLTETIGMTRIVAALCWACGSSVGAALDRTSILLASSADQVDWTQTGLSSLTDSTSPPSPSANARHGIPLIVHHGFMDLLFLMTHFITPTLPEQLSQCKALILRHFPCIYDTKVLAAERSTGCNFLNSSLGESFDRITTDQSLLQYVDDDDDGVQCHEAAYDAYMTGLCYLGLCQDIQSNTGLTGASSSLHLGNREHFYPLLDGSKVSAQVLRCVFARNCLYHTSLYTIYLDNPEVDRMRQGLFLESTFYVSDVDPTISPRTFADETKGAYRSQPYGLDTYRVGDRNFLVTIAFTGDPCKSSAADFLSMVREQGSALEKVLRPKFSVSRLDDYLRDEVPSDGHLAGLQVFHRLASWIGFLPWLFSEDKPSDNVRKCSIQNDIVLDPALIGEWQSAVDSTSS